MRLMSNAFWILPDSRYRTIFRATGKQWWSIKQKNVQPLIYWAERAVLMVGYSGFEPLTSSMSTAFRMLTLYALLRLILTDKDGMTTRKMTWPSKKCVCCNFVLIAPTAPTARANFRSPFRQFVCDEWEKLRDFLTLLLCLLVRPLLFLKNLVAPIPDEEWREKKRDSYDDDNDW